MKNETLKEYIEEYNPSKEAGIIIDEIDEYHFSVTCCNAKNIA